MPPSSPYRSGFAALIGRPNVGKSTLLNRLAGEKLAIVSPKAQTTRSRILGVVTRPEGQVAFIDTPGIHKAKGELNRYMLEQAYRSLTEAELVLLLVDATAAQRPGTTELVDPRNGEIIERIRREGKTALLVLNKIDALPKPALLPLMDAYQKAFPFVELVPVSSLTGENLDTLFAVVLSHLPEGPPVFDEGMLTDQAERTLAAEYVREQLLRQTRQEVPYSTAVVVDVFDESEREEEPPEAAPPPPRSARSTGKPGKGKAGARQEAPVEARRSGLRGLVRIAATIFVERESQKAIVIGKQGQMLKAIGTEARKSIERLLGAHVYLSLRVKVEPRWSERADGLRKLGYE